MPYRTPPHRPRRKPGVPHLRRSPKLRKGRRYKPRPRPAAPPLTLGALTCGGVVRVRQVLGRMRVPIDWRAFNVLCRVQASLGEIAAYFECSEATIENAVRRTFGVRFSDYWARKAPRGRLSLRRKQFQLALKGNVVMLIWLGKQYLGQQDHAEALGRAVSEDERGAPVPPTEHERAARVADLLDRAEQRKLRLA